MFLSERSRITETGGSQVEQISLGGSAPTVAGMEYQYDVRLFGPGGMQWVPKRGQTVLVIKAGSLGEESCVAGAAMEASTELEPGELRLCANGCSLELKNDGSIRLQGSVFLNGEELTI